MLREQLVDRFDFEAEYSLWRGQVEIGKRIIECHVGDLAQCYFSD